MKFFYIIILMIGFSFVRCTSAKEVEKTQKNRVISSEEYSNCPIPLQIGKLYGRYADKEEAKRIYIEIAKLLHSICLGNLNDLPDMIYPQMGLFVDAKAHWTREEVISDLKNKDGYFNVYFFDSDRLDEKKGSKGNLTIQQALVSSGGIFVDFHFDSALESELQFRFSENPKNVRYLINPIFGKFEGKWMLLRMF
ncbi:hypothetical protein [Leptospira ilyithenensis]|uniref:Uncharacterized protein n=1 Tax=Leptospira ilyithenensis TaxID=2484901 RepID=A0A4R9LVC2_9LEPT|nr:hypothetical protein [Leptospira ilyithenensis]TGN13373.1 hypothetical protein EHS11_03845 [Leptospira ilyithenensis]